MWCSESSVTISFRKLKLGVCEKRKKKEKKYFLKVKWMVVFEDNVNNLLFLLSLLFRLFDYKYAIIFVHILYLLLPLL